MNNATTTIETTKQQQ